MSNKSKEPMLRITFVTGKVDPSQIPEYVAENLAQAMWPGLLRAWNDPEFRAGYERWKAERQRGGNKPDHRAGE